MDALIVIIDTSQQTPQPISEPTGPVDLAMGGYAAKGLERAVQGGSVKGDEMRADRKTMDTSSPMKAIRAMCLECVGYVSDEVKNCTAPDCPVHPFRLGRSIRGRSRLKAIKQHCLECMGGSRSTVKECHSGPRLADDEPGCPVHEYRTGHNPKLKGKRKATQKAMEALRRFRSQARDVGKRPPESTISTKGIQPPRESQMRANDSRLTGM